MEVYSYLLGKSKGGGGTHPEIHNTYIVDLAKEETLEPGGYINILDSDNLAQLNTYYDEIQTYPLQCKSELYVKNGSTITDKDINKSNYQVYTGMAEIRVSGEFDMYLITLRGDKEQGYSAFLDY